MIRPLPPPRFRQKYWDIGRLILDRQQREGWVAKVIDRLSQDLPGQTEREADPLRNTPQRF